jgi:serine/threonine protein kinase
LREVCGQLKTDLRGCITWPGSRLKPASPLSDLFSLAVVTYEALTLRKPFKVKRLRNRSSIQKFGRRRYQRLNHKSFLSVKW